MKKSITQSQLTMKHNQDDETQSSNQTKNLSDAFVYGKDMRKNNKKDKDVYYIGCGKNGDEQKEYGALFVDDKIVWEGRFRGGVPYEGSGISLSLAIELKAKLDATFIQKEEERNEAKTFVQKEKERKEENQFQNTRSKE